MKDLPLAFTERMKKLLSEEEFESYINSYNEPAVKAFRVNTEKISVAEFEKIAPFATERIPYAETGFYLTVDKIGNHPFHHAGMIYVQDPGAMAPAECLELQPDWCVLDMCAAPGGKSSQLRNKLGENGVLISNEIIRSRCKILTGNIERLGFRNTATTCLDPARVAQIFPAAFDMIMVDAPCSGEGMFRKDDIAIDEWSEENVAHCAERQQGILEHAAEALKPGGYIVYSTCTFSLEENEMTVDAFLQAHPDFELIPVRDAVKQHTADGIFFDGCRCKNMNEARRFYPHKSRGEGQFMAVLHNTQQCMAQAAPPKRQTAKIDRVVMDFLQETLTDFDPSLVSIYNGNPVYAAPAMVPEKLAFACGVTIGEVRKNYMQPHHQFFMAMGTQFRRQIDLAPGSEALEKYLHGEEIAVDCNNGWAVITTCGCTVGGAKVTNGRAKNHYPKGLRKLK